MRGISVVAPSFRPHSREILAAVEVLERAGLPVRLGDVASSGLPDYNSPFRDYSYRVRELVSALRDPETDVIWFCDGGAGSSYLLPLLDMEWSKSPWNTSKIFVGFSDVNYLMLYLIRLGHWGYLGPNCLIDADNRKNQLAIAVDQIFNDKVPSLRVEPVDVIRAGTAEGLFLGGNFSVLASISGTRYCPTISQSVLFFEEHGPNLPGQHEYLFWEKMQSVQLREDWLGVHGFLVGEIQTSGPYEDREDLFPPIEEVLHKTLCPQTDGPIASGFSFGESQKQLLPIGVPVRMEAKRGLCRLEFDFRKSVVSNL